MRLDHVRAITFDAGGTLIEPWPSVGHVYAEVSVRHGVRNLSAEMLNHRFAAVWRGLKHFGYSRAEWAGVVDRTFEGLTEMSPSQTFFDELYDRFSEPDAWRVFDDVLPALESLAARRYKLGVISNWDDRLVPLLRRLNLFNYFNAVTVSCEAEASKPSPAIFELAAKRLSLPARAILHIGDDPAVDVQGACAGGFQALLLQRGAKPAAGSRISSLVELCALQQPSNGRESGWGPVSV